MSKPCEWCVSTSNQIDSIEYENELLIEALKEIAQFRYSMDIEKYELIFDIADKAIKESLN